MNDAVIQGFLAQQYADGQRLLSSSDVLQLLPMGNGVDPPDRYLAKFACKGVLRDPDGTIAIRQGEFVVGIAFSSDYLRHVEPLHVVTWLGPDNFYHPNVTPPWMCIGRILPGTGLVDLLFQTFEIITYHNWAAHDFVHADAANWARNNQHLLPVDSRTLIRRKLPMHVEPAPSGEEQP